MFQYYCIDCGNIDTYFKEPKGFIRCSKCNGTLGSAGMFKYFSPSEKLYVADSLINKSVLGVIGNDTYRKKTLVVPEGTQTIPTTFSDNPYIEEVRFPSSIRKIEMYAFSGCSKLKRVVFQNTSNCTIGSSAFAGCTSLEEVILADGVIEIEGSAFNGCKNLKKVTIPRTLKTIGNYAFADCNIELAVFPDSSYGYSDTTFGYYTKNVKCFIKGNKPLGEKDFTLGAFRYYIKDKECMLTNKSFVDGSLYGMQIKDYTNVSVPSGVKRIEPYAFADEEIENIEFPWSLEVIKEAAFYGCDKIQSIKFNSGLQKIEDSAFSTKFCFATIKKLEIPSSVKYIGKDAFKGHKIEEIVFHEGLETIGSGAFSDCEISNVDLPKTVTSLAANAFGSKTAVSVDGLSVEAKKLRDDLIKRKNELKSTIERKRREIVSKEGNIKTLTDAIPIYKSSIEGKTTDLARLQLEIDEKTILSQEICKTANMQIQFYEEKINQLKAARDEIIEKKAQAEKDLSTASIFAFSKKRTLTESIEQYEKDQKQLADEIEQIAENKKSEQNIISKENNEISSLKKKTADLNSQISSARNRIENNNSEIQLEQKRIEQLEKDIENSSSIIDSIEASIEERVREKNREFEKRKLILEKERLLKVLPVHISGFPYTHQKSKSDESGNIDEVLVNRSFGEYALLQKEQYLRDLYQKSYQEQKSELDRIIQINELLGIDKYDGISEYSVIEGELEELNKEIGVPERFAWLNSYFSKIDSWHSLRKCKAAYRDDDSYYYSLLKEFFKGIVFFEVAYSDIIIFPCCVAAMKKDGYLDIRYFTDIDISYEFKEKEYKRPPKDLEIVSKYYLHQNADGSPSKRYKTNPLLYKARESFIAMEIPDQNGKKKKYQIRVDKREKAENFVSAFKKHTQALKTGLNGKIYRAATESADLEAIQSILLNEQLKEKDRLAQEQKQLLELKRIEEEKRRIAEEKKEKKRQALIAEQKKLNEERRAERERERRRQQKLSSLFGDDTEPVMDKPSSSSAGSITLDENSVIEIVGNKTISNNVFKIKVKQVQEIEDEQLTLFFTDDNGRIISNKKIVRVEEIGTESVVGFVLKGGIDFTTMGECSLKIEGSSKDFGSIPFKMNISFYSDF